MVKRKSAKEVPSAKDPKWRGFKKMIDKRRAWTSVRLEEIANDIKEGSPETEPWWNELEYHLARFRQWPAPRLADLMDRIEDGREPRFAGYKEMINEVD
ncbi:MAG: hypothetical protein FJ320_07045 [SAR202 cluster bacterium]|nr:hypothetical protein [SAR202 cluster bacterium]